MFAAEASVLAWVRAVHARLPELLRDAPARHGGTWVPGVDLLPNDADGALDEGAVPLGGEALNAAQAIWPAERLHRAQISVTRPGYPRRDVGESDAAHRFRRLRDAAHLDGLLPFGPDKRRFLREPHAWILGIALTEAAPDAAPLVAWRGSADVMRGRLAAALSQHPTEVWHQVDLTDVYAAARRDIFEQCERVAIPLRPGEGVLMHRATLHGVAPWVEDGSAPVTANPLGRAIAYFRPQLPSVKDWVSLG